MAPGRREIYNFPIDSLESTQPLLMKRKKLTKVDVQPVEGWRYAVKKLNFFKLIKLQVAREKELSQHLEIAADILDIY